MSTTKKKAAPAKAPAKTAPKNSGTYYAARHLNEGGAHYEPGDVVPCDAARAKALGDLVTTEKPK